MAAIVEVHAHHRITGLQKGKEHRHVGLCTGVRLHIGIFGTKEFFRPFNGQRLYFIHEFAAAIITFAGIAFGILIGEHTALGSEHSGTDNVFRSDKLQFLPLAIQLTIDILGNFRIRLLQNFL